MSFATTQATRTTPARGSYTMREMRSASREEWDSLLASGPGGGHVFQSYVWGEFKREIGWKPVRLVLERDGEPVGFGQFLVRSTLPVPGTLMYATKGPWLPWEDEDAVRTFFRGVRTVAEREGAHTVKIEPEVLQARADIKALLSDIGFRRTRYDLQSKTTMVVDLEPAEEDILGRMTNKTRNIIRSGAKKGIEVVEDNSQEARDEFWRLMEITSERDGYMARRSAEYHQSVWEAMLRAGQGHLFLATHEGERLAGMFVYTFGKKYYYMNGASSNEKRNLNPTYVLQWEVMRWAREHGYTYYDMVAIPNPDNLNESDPLWGVYKFKSRFGGAITEFVGCLDWPVRPVQAGAWYRFEPLYYRAYQKLKHDIYY